jgi:hypothetical protein
MFVYIDERNRIMAYNPNDMSGNTGWEEVKEDVADPIFNDDGVPLYKYSKGRAVSRTSKEIAADTPKPEVVTPTEIEQLRADVDYIAMETGVEL